ncbi:hypothetical protein CJU89_6846 [Yarrowia sp. B02]|nr:hypothetical protein CJU89_6846 [Yarrowia sp. B02]
MYNRGSYEYYQAAEDANAPAEAADTPDFGAPGSIPANYAPYSQPGPDHMMGSYINQLGTPHLVSSLFLSPPTEESTISTPGTAAITAPRHSVEMNLRQTGGPTPPFLPDYPLYTYDFRYGRKADSNSRQDQGSAQHGQSNPQQNLSQGQSNLRHQQSDLRHQQGQGQHPQSNPQHQPSQGQQPSQHLPKTSPTTAKTTPPGVSPVAQKAGLNLSPTLSSGSPSQQSPSPEEMAYSSSFSAKSENPKRVYKKKTLTAQQKLVHNQIERKYRSAINLGLLRLKSLVPWYQLLEEEESQVKREEDWEPGSVHPSQDTAGCPYPLDELATLSSKAGILQVTAEYVQYLQGEVARLREEASANVA